MHDTCVKCLKHPATHGMCWRCEPREPKDNIDLSLGLGTSDVHACGYPSVTAWAAALHKQSLEKPWWAQVIAKEKQEI